MAELTPKSQNSAAQTETLHDLEAGALTVEGYSSSQPPRSGNLRILPCIAVGCVCSCFASSTSSLTVHSFQTSLILKALNRMVIPTEAVRSFSSFNWVALMCVASDYSIYKRTARGCPDTRIRGGPLLQRQASV